MLREHHGGPIPAKWKKDQLLKVGDENSPFYGYLMRVMRVRVNESGDYYYLTLWGNNAGTILRFTLKEDQLITEEEFRAYDAFSNSIQPQETEDMR